MNTFKDKFYKVSGKGSEETWREMLVTRAITSS
jgi:hypothetical protein